MCCYSSRIAHFVRGSFAVPEKLELSQSSGTAIRKTNQRITLNTVENVFLC